MIKPKLTCLLLVSFILAAPLLRAGVPPATWVAARLSVCVYCGASDRADSKYAAVARELGEALARRQWTLVWGGGQTGLMGAVARGAKETGGRVVGVIPEFIRQWEVAYKEADEMMVVTTMAERKTLLQARSDAFVILPGGIGTLDEIADTLDLRNLSQHDKPIILLNQDGFYDALLAFIDHTVATKFSKSEVRGKIMVANTVDEVLAFLEKLQPAASR